MNGKGDLPLAGENVEIPTALSDRVNQLIQMIRPAVQTEKRRHKVADYVRGIISKCFAPKHKVEAFMFGSVPLRTYLPDGDIDVSIFCEARGLQATWGEQLQESLEREAENPDAMFKVGNVQLINAEVKLLKCLVDNIVVDISFNQIGGLCTLNFLEAMDRTIGSKHLFKRSIILIKAWCYYESRVLGAQYSLLSTYALETMVLYIFNVHHAVLQTPLEVLYKFLMVFHQFEWDKYCLTLSGPVQLKTLEHDAAISTPTEQGSTLLTTSCMGVMLKTYSYDPVVPTNTKGPAFPKCINIMDPLLNTNNLGRSVSKTSEIRIRNAFGYGARMLGQIFRKDVSEALESLDQFFRNTWSAQRRPRPSPQANSQATGPNQQSESTKLPKDPSEPAAQTPTNSGTFPGFPGHAITNATQFAAQNSTSSGRYPPPPPVAPRAQDDPRAARNGTVVGLQAQAQVQVPPPPPGPPPSQPLPVNHGADSPTQLAEGLNMMTGRAGVLAGGIQTGHQARMGTVAGANMRSYLEAQGLAGNAVGEAVIGQAIGNRAAMETVAGVGVSVPMQLSGFEQWNMFNPWVMAANPWVLQPYYQVPAARLPAQESEVVKPRAVQVSGGRTGGSRQERGKGLLRVKSAPTLGEVVRERRERNLDRRIMHSHPVPYPKELVSQMQFNELAHLVSSPQSGIIPGVQKVQQVEKGVKPTFLASHAGTSSGRAVGLPAWKVAHLGSSIRLDEKTLAKLEVIEKRAKQEEAAENAARSAKFEGEGGKSGDQGAPAEGQDNEPRTPSGTGTPIEEPPDTEESPKMVTEPPMVVADTRHRNQTQSEMPETRERPLQPRQTPKQVDVRQEMTQVDLSRAMLNFGTLNAGGRHMVNAQALRQDRQIAPGAVDLAANAELVNHQAYAPVLPFYVPQLAQVQLTQLYGAMGVPPQVNIQPQPGRHAVTTNRGVARAAIKNPQVEQAATVADLFGANYQQSGVLPISYVNRTATGSAGRTTAEGHIAVSPSGGGLSHLPPHQHAQVAQVQHSPGSWGLIYQGTSPQSTTAQKPVAEVNQEGVRDSEDVLSGDLESLTQHLMVARNCVGKKQPDRSRPPVAGRGAGLGRGGRMEPNVSDPRSRKRHQHNGEEVRAYPHSSRSTHGYERGGRGDRNREHQHNQQHLNAGYQTGYATQATGYSPMVAYPMPYPPPPPPHGGGSETQVPMHLPMGEDGMFQIHSNLPAQHGGTFFIQPQVGGPIVAGAPVAGSQFALQSIPSNAAMTGHLMHEAPQRNSREWDAQPKSRDRPQWRVNEEPRTSKPLSVSTDDGGIRVEIDPSVLKAVEAALTGTAMQGDTSHKIAMTQAPTEHASSKADDHHRNPPIDTFSPRSAQSKSTDGGGSGGSNSSHRSSARKRGDNSRHGDLGVVRGHVPLVTQDGHSAIMQNPPVVFGEVPPGSVEGLTFLATGGGPAATAKNGQMAMHYEALPAQQRGMQGAPRAESFLISHGQPSYGTGSFIPLVPPYTNEAKTQNIGDPPGSRASADGDRQSVPDGEQLDDGSSGSISAESERGEETRMHQSRRYNQRYKGNKNPKLYHHNHHDYNSRPPRGGYRNSYGWNGGDHWGRVDGGVAAVRDMAEFCPEYPPGAYFYPDARTGAYGYAGGYDFDEVFAAYDTHNRGYRAGGHGHWKGHNRRDRDYDRWAVYGREVNKSHTDRSSTPDSAASHNTVRSQGRNFGRRDPDRWDGNRRYSNHRGNKRGDSFDPFHKRMRDSDGVDDDQPGSSHSSRSNHDHMFDRRMGGGHHRQHGRPSAEWNRNRRGSVDDSKPKTFTFQEEDFPTLEAASLPKVGGSNGSQGGSQRGTPKGSELNPIR